MSDIKKKAGRPKSGKPPKAGVSFRLSAEAVAMLPILADEIGSSQTAVIELALRDLAKLRGVPWQKTPKP